MSIAKDPDKRCREFLELRESRFGFALLIDAEAGVEQQNQSDGNRFDRESVCTFHPPSDRVGDQGEEEDED